MAKFTITKLRTLEGNENIAFECHLCVNRKVVARVSNTGTGGCHQYDWKNSVVRNEYEKKVTDELIWDLIEEKLPPQIVEIPITIIEDRLRADLQLAKTCDAIAHQLGEGWFVGAGVGGTTEVGHPDPDNFRFYCSIELDDDPRYYTHTLCICIGFPDEIVNVCLSPKESAQRRISFDLRTDTVEKIVGVLLHKLDWFKSKLPELRDRAAKEQDGCDRIRQSGTELAQKLGMSIKYTTNGGRENGFAVERIQDNGFGECVSINVGSHVYGDGTNSFSLSSCRISDEKLLKLLEFCKQLDI